MLIRRSKWVLVGVYSLFVRSLLLLIAQDTFFCISTLFVFVFLALFGDRMHCSGGLSSTLLNRVLSQPVLNDIPFFLAF